MVGKTTRWAPLARSGVLALALAAFIPLAIPAAASANTDRTAAPASQGEEFVNDVNATAFQYLKNASHSNATLDVGVTNTVSAVNRVNALTKCSGCTAVALGLQMVTATLQSVKNLHALDVATATSEGCLTDCNAVAVAYQLVVATDTPLPLTFGQFLNTGQLAALNDIRVDFDTLSYPSLTLSQIQSDAKALADQAETILEDGSYTPPGTTPITPFAAVFTAFLPTFSPAAPGVDLATGSSGTEQPVVTLYKDVKYDPWLTS
jgi:hypothetical protein